MPATICREKYFNYGSYLRSRGYDKEICNLVSNIENGNINVGSFAPNGTTGGGTITGNLKVTGTFEATGGNATTPSIIASNGIRASGLLEGMVDVSLGNTTSSLAFFGSSGSVQGSDTVNVSNLVIDLSGAIDASGAGAVIGTNTKFKPDGSTDEYTIQQVIQILHNYGLLK